MLKKSTVAVLTAFALFAFSLGSPTSARADSGTANSGTADSGSIEMHLFKAAFLIGGTGGTGSMTFDGQTYPLSIGGISAGLTIALSETSLNGTVKNISDPAQIEGVYSAAGAGLAVAAGGQAAVMTNANGVTIELAGTEMGVDASLDLTGLTITIRR